MPMEERWKKRNLPICAKCKTELSIGVGVGGGRPRAQWGGREAASLLSCLPGPVWPWPWLLVGLLCSSARSMGNCTPELYFLMHHGAELNENIKNRALIEMPLSTTLEREAGFSGRAPFSLSSGLSSATPRSRDWSFFTGLSVPGRAPFRP